MLAIVPRDGRAAYATDFNEVKGIGGDGITTASSRLPDQTHNAIFSQSAGGPALLWNGVARNLAEDPSQSLDAADTALLLAQMNLSAADASINCWNDKYTFDFWRPWQAIRQADLDDNAATAADLSWTPLLTAPYPDHTSGHMCLDGAHLRVLQMFFDTDVMHFGVTSSQFGGETRFFDRFSEPLDEIAEARIWAGLHFRSADVQEATLVSTSRITWPTTTSSQSATTDSHTRGAASATPREFPAHSER